MKYIGFFILTLMGWNSWGLKFACEGEQARVQELQWKIQNYQNYSNRYKASQHQELAYCQMALGNPKSALQNLRTASDDFGQIVSNYFLARYLITGGWGQDKAAFNRNEAIWEFEKTLSKINAIFADYPNEDWMAEGELSQKIYPGTLISLIQAYTDKYLAEGYGFYYETPPTYYDDPAKAIQRHQANKDILDRLEYHITSCLADQEGQNMMTRSRRFDYMEDFEQKLAEYNDFYFKIKATRCPHYKALLETIKEREEAMFSIALNCTRPPEQPTADRPSCADIKIETTEFATFFTEEWLPQKNSG